LFNAVNRLETGSQGLVQTGLSSANGICCNSHICRTFALKTYDSSKALALQVKDSDVLSNRELLSNADTLSDCGQIFLKKLCQNMLTKMS